MDPLARDFVRMVDDPTIKKVCSDAGQAALEPVQSAVRGALPHMSGDLAGTLRMGRNKYGAGLRYGSAKVNYAGPVDFGAWPPGRPFIQAGRYLYPAAKELGPETQRRYEAALDAGINAFRWTNEGDTAHD
jgi:hypothetical protein